MSAVEEGVLRKLELVLVSGYIAVQTCRSCSGPSKEEAGENGKAETQ